MCKNGVHAILDDIALCYDHIIAKRCGFELTCYTPDCDGLIVPSKGRYCADCKERRALLRTARREITDPI